MPIELITVLVLILVVALPLCGCVIYLQDKKIEALAKTLRELQRESLELRRQSYAMINRTLALYTVIKRKLHVGGTEDDWQNLDRYF